MNLLKIFKSIKGFYKSIDLTEKEVEKLAEELDNKDVRFKFFFENSDSNKAEGIQIYGDKISYQDLELFIDKIRNKN
jgi:hypothetical protein